MLCQQRAQESYCANPDKRLSTAKACWSVTVAKNVPQNTLMKMDVSNPFKILSAKLNSQRLVSLLLLLSIGLLALSKTLKNNWWSKHNTYQTEKHTYIYIYFFHQMLYWEKCFTNPYTVRSFNVFCVVWELFKCILTSGSGTKRKRSVAALWLADSPMTGTPLQSYIFQSFLNTFFCLQETSWHMPCQVLTIIFKRIWILHNSHTAGFLPAAIQADMADHWHTTVIQTEETPTWLCLKSSSPHC